MSSSTPMEYAAAHQSDGPGPTPARDMAWVPGGTFRMGSDDFYPEERPVHAVAVDGFWMDEHPVTVAEFRRFVKATGHVTLAEQPPDPADYPDADPALLIRAPSCSSGPDGPVALDDSRTGGPTCPRVSGGSRRDPPATSTVAIAIPSCT